MKSFREYIGDFWNKIDALLLSSYAIYTVIALSNIIEVESFIYKAIACTVTVLSFIKLNYFLGIFENYSFLVSMLLGTFYDLQTFLAFFSFVILTFSIMILILIPGANEIY